MTIIDPITNIRFQFHKGAIRTCHAVYVTEDKRHFNSIKVRLELSSHLSGHIPFLFQFHKGAIRTIPLMAVTSNEPNFNSIKVRLEHSNLEEAFKNSDISIP